jgi:hypothetical protein
VPRATRHVLGAATAFPGRNAKAFRYDPEGSLSVKALSCSGTAYRAVPRATRHVLGAATAFPGRNAKAFRYDPEGNFFREGTLL